MTGTEMSAGPQSPESSREEFFLASSWFLVVADDSWNSLAGGAPRQALQPLSQGFLPCGGGSVLWYMHTTLASTLIKYDLVLINYICKGLFAHKVTF